MRLGSRHHRCAPALAWPLVRLLGSYDVIVWLFIGQALAQVAVSHAIAREPYRVARDPETLRRYLAFGWPMIAAALPHAATYHGERAIIGRFLGMEALAGYTAGFLLTSAAGLIAARLGQALVLPLLSAARTDPVVFKNRFIRLHELHVIAAAVLATGAIVGGNAVLRVAFGKQYWSYGGVLAWLAVLTAIRIVQSPAALALMAHGETRIGLIATLVRAAAVGPIVLAAMAGATLESIIAIGVAGEAMSMLVYVIGLSRWIGRDIIGQTLARSAWLVAMLTIAWTMPAMPGTIAGLALTGTLALAVVAIGVLVMPQARETTRQGLGSLG